MELRNATFITISGRASHTLKPPTTENLSQSSHRRLAHTTLFPKEATMTPSIQTILSFSLLGRRSLLVPDSLNIHTYDTNSMHFLLSTLNETMR